MHIYSYTEIYHIPDKDIIYTYHFLYRGLPAIELPKSSKIGQL